MRKWIATLTLVMAASLFGATSAQAVTPEIGYFSNATTRHLIIDSNAVVWRDGVRYGAYVDDTYPGNKQQRIYDLHNQGYYRVWIGEYYWGENWDKAMELQEVYPWYHSWQCCMDGGLPYSPNYATGYIIQAFNWNQAGCTNCDYPTYAQQHLEFCKVKTWPNANYIFWYWDDPAHRTQVTNAQSNPC